MEIGDRVIYYTHDMSNRVSTTVDVFAIVIGIVNEDTVDVVAFPPGGPVQFFRVSRFNPEEPGVVGLSYWRPKGEAPPEFDKLYSHYTNPEWVEMMNRHKAEQAKVKPEDLDKLKAKHKSEREALYTKLEKTEPIQQPKPAKPFEPSKSGETK